MFQNKVLERKFEAFKDIQNRKPETVPLPVTRIFTQTEKKSANNGLFIISWSKLKVALVKTKKLKMNH